MPDYRRLYVAGGSYFFTVVVFHRRNIFTVDQNRDFIRDAISSVQESFPFQLDAMVLLPEHFHCIMTLPNEDVNYSTRMRLIKSKFTTSYSRANPGGLSYSRAKRKQRDVWQPRFWEHTIRDENDFEHCFDYIHWNPVKHDLVKHVKDYQWSTFHKYVKLGYYPQNWGDSGEVPMIHGAEWD